MRRTRHDIGLLALGVTSAVAVWVLGTSILKWLPDPDMTRWYGGALWYAAFHIPYFLLPWVPVVLIICRTRQPDVFRALPWLAALSLAAFFILDTITTDSGDADISGLGMWFLVGASLVWFMGLPAWALSLLVGERIHKQNATGASAELAGTRTDDLPRDIWPIVLVVAAIGCVALDYLIWASYVNVPDGFFGALSLVMAFCPWVFIVLAILLARRPNVCRCVPILALVGMGVVCLVGSGISIVTAARDLPYADGALMLFGAMLPLNTIVPGMLLILWARRRAQKLALSSSNRPDRREPTS
jgi:hypothetical protein